LVAVVSEQTAPDRGDGDIGDVEIDEFVSLFTAALHTVEHALMLDASAEVGTGSEVSA
jgi:hypothetical protein